MELPIDNTRLAIKVKPNAGKDSITVVDGVVVVSVKALAEDGKANLAVCKLLKKATGRTCRVVLGATSRRKVIQFE